MPQTIFVYLPGEAVPVYAPVDAEHVHDDVYRIVDCRGEDDALEFGKGAMVRCRLEVKSGKFGKLESVLTAFERAS